MSPVIEFRVLGPFEVRVDGEAVELGGPRRRALVALLTARLGRVVSVDALVDGLWGDRPPADAHRTARTYVSRLRQVLGGLIVTQPAGYLLRLPPERVDAARFALAAAAGRDELAADRPAAALQRLTAGLALWRGEPYGEFAEIPELGAETARLRRLHLAATEDRIAAELATGAGDALVEELVGLTEAHPGHDRLWGQLMTALYRAGRQADAVEAFLRARAELVDRAGLDPSPALVEIHRQVLAHDPRLLGPRPIAHRPTASLEQSEPLEPPVSGPRLAGESAAGRSARTTPLAEVRSAAAGGRPDGVRLVRIRPAQLPPDVAGFTGRRRELSELDSTAAGAGVCVVSGTAGVGKTALAVRWARQAAAAFPDGQCYVNLRGFDPGGATLSPAEAVRGLLDAFGVPPAGIPRGLAAQTGLYRSLLAGRRVLVLLDNAKDAAQVRPLLPGTPGCLTLVTSRDQLTSLAVAEGARLLTADLLDPEAARELLVGRLGAARVSAEPDAVAEITAYCAGLPLALAIVAARAAAQPHLPLAVFGKELRESGRRLDFLDGGDPLTQVRAVFSWSYRALDPPAARLFRLLGLHPGPDIGLAAIAGLAGASVPEVRALLSTLTRGHLVSESTPDRYTCHDLLRGYAAELAVEQDGPRGRAAATHRMLDHYVHTARAADAVLTPQPHPIDLPPPRPGAGVVRPLSHQDALAWFQAEHPVLLAVLAQAAAWGFDGHAWQLAAMLTTFLDRHGYWRELAEAQTTALAAARRQADRLGQATAARGLGLARDRLGQAESAREHYHRALDLFAGLDDRPGQARTRQHLARMAAAQGDHALARDHARHSLTHYRAAGDRAGQSAALNHLAWCTAQLGHYAEALPPCEQALTLAEEIGDLNGQAHIWDSLGYVHQHLGLFTRAVDCYRAAVELFHRTGERHGELASLVALGDSQHAATDAIAARQTWLRATHLADDLALPAPDPIRATLADRVPI